MAALGAITLGFASLRAASATATATTVSVFVPRFLCRVLLSLLIFFPLSPQIKSPSGDPIFESFGVSSFVKLGDGVLWVWVWLHCNTEIKDSATTDYYLRVGA